MCSLQDSKIFEDTLGQMTSAFYQDSLDVLFTEDVSKFDMDVVTVIFKAMADGTYTYERNGKVVDSQDQLADEVLADFKKRTYKTHALPPGVAQALQQFFAPPSQEVSIATNLYNVLRDIHIGDTQLPVHAGLESLIVNGEIKTAEQLVKVCSAIISAVGVVKGKLGSVDPSVVLSVDDAKDNLSRCIVKSTVSITTPVLLTRLIQYQFEMEVKGGVPSPLSFEVLQTGYELSVVMKLDTEVITFNVNKGTVSVTGDVRGFFTVWNAHLKSEVMEYVLVTDADKMLYDTLLVVYDLKYNHKIPTWSMTRHADVTRAAAFTKFSIDDWKIVSQCNAAIVAEMNKHGNPPAHYYDQYNLFLLSCQRVCDFNDIYKTKLNEIAVAAFQSSSMYVSKSMVEYKNIMAGNVGLKDAIKLALDARADRSKYRNISAREALTKNMMDPLYPMYPSPFVTARKFLSIMASNQALYESDADVYGCARMHFYGSVGTQHKLAGGGKIGARKYYDVNSTFTGNTVGVEVEPGDLYAIPEGVGKGRGLIDDVHLPYGKEVREKIGDAIITFQAGCMSHKIRILHKGQYEHACLKMVLNKMKSIDLDPEIGATWLLPLSYYKTVIFDTPGKLQSGEFFIYVSGRLPTSNPTKLTALKRQWRLFCQRKCAVMVFGHGVMNAATLAAGKGISQMMMRRSSFFDLRSIRSALPETLRGGVEKSVILNGLNTFVKDVGLNDGGKFLYKPYLPVGKVYTPLAQADKDNLSMDMNTLI